MTVRHSRITRAFHWLIALAVVFQIPLAYIMIDQPLSPEKLGNYALHKSVGLAIFAATALRLAWKLLQHAPVNTGHQFRRLAVTSHASLYGLTLMMPLVGWLGSSAANFPVSFFGWFTLPDLVAPSKELHDALKLAHRWMAYALVAIVSVHVGAALYHHWILRDDVLRSMVPWNSSRSKDTSPT